MTISARGALDIEAQLQAPVATAQLVHYHFAEPPDSCLRVDGQFRLELCLTARHPSARACFPGVWNPSRFERIGDVFLVPPGMDMATRSDEQGSLTSLVCLLNRTDLMALFDEAPELTDSHLISCLDIRDATIRGLLLRLAGEVRQPGLASELLVESIASQLTIELFRIGAAIPQSRARGGLAPWQLRRIDERLRELRRAPTLTELADLCRLSVRQLSRGFRESHGYSIGSHVVDSQMTHARDLLAQDRSVTEVAKTLGFSCSSNFCVAFRRATGMTPGQFRQALLRH